VHSYSVSSREHKHQSVKPGTLGLKTQRELKSSQKASAKIEINHNVPNGTLIPTCCHNAEYKLRFSSCSPLGQHLSTINTLVSILTAYCPYTQEETLDIIGNSSCRQLLANNVSDSGTVFILLHIQVPEKEPRRIIKN
jgi:hypothetical protein